MEYYPNNRYNDGHYLNVYFTKIAPNYINALALRWHCADIAQHCAKEKLIFFGEMGLLRRRKPGAIQAQNTIAPIFNKLINIIKKQLFIPNKKIIIKIS